MVVRGPQYRYYFPCDAVDQRKFNRAAANDYGGRGETFYFSYRYF